MANRIVIVMDGGLVQDVLSGEPIEYCVVDYDVEGADEDRLTKIPQSEGEPIDGYCYTGKADVMPERVAELFETVSGVTDAQLKGPIVVCSEHIETKNDDCRDCSIEWAQQTRRGVAQ